MEISKIRYASDNINTTMVYTLDPDERMDVFTNGMLTNNNIKGILAQSYEINNGVQTLCYTVTRGIPLSTLFRQNLKKGVVLKIFCNIAEIIMRTEEYMIDTNKIILNENYIFVDGATLDISMLLIPTNKPFGNTLRTFIQHWIMSGVFDTSEDAAYPVHINNFLNANPNATAKQVFDYLNKMLSGVVVSAPAQQLNVNAAYPSQPAGAPGIQQNKPVQQVQQMQPQMQSQPVQSQPMQGQQSMAVPGQAPQDNGKKGGILGGLFDKKNKQNSVPAPQPAMNVPNNGMAVPNAGGKSPAPQPQAGGMAIPGSMNAPAQGGMAVPGKDNKAPQPKGMAVPGSMNAPAPGGMAVPGKNNKAPQPQQKGMAVPGSMNAPAPGGMAIPGMNNKAPQPQQKGMAVPGSMNAPAPGGMAIPGMNNKAPAGNGPMLKKQQPPVQPQQQYAPAATTEVAKEEIIDNTGDATLMVGFGKSQSGVPCGYLVRNGCPDVKIDRDSFFIGRGTNTSIVNNFIINNGGVGRNHAVIERSGIEYYVKDNNSINGTFINGVRINPNVKYKLNPGDNITFATEQYRFVIK